MDQAQQTSQPVEGEQLAQAAANILKTEEFVPRNKRWGFSRSSKAHKDYERIVQDVTVRRRSARVRAFDERLKQERAAADSTFETSKASAEASHRERTAQSRKPYDETEAKARRERDAAIAAANSAYQSAIDGANRVFQAQATLLDQTRDGLLAEAKVARDKAYAAIEARRKAEMVQIERELKAIPLEGPTRIIENREIWTWDDRRKALIGLVDMAGRDDFDAVDTEECLNKIASYVVRDRLLEPNAGQALMHPGLLEALTDLARRTPEKRPLIVRYLLEVSASNPGHSSAVFIKTLSELYVIASSDLETVYATDPKENDRIVDTMREQIADTLKRTPRPSSIPPRPLETTSSSRASSLPPTGNGTPKPQPDGEITKDLDAGELVPVKGAQARGASEAIVEKPATRDSAAPDRPQSSGPPPVPQLKRIKKPEGEKH